MWNVLENGYLEPHANTRIDFNKERGKVVIQLTRRKERDSFINYRLLKIIIIFDGLRFFAVWRGASGDQGCQLDCFFFVVTSTRCDL